MSGVCAYVIDVMDRSKFPDGTAFVRRASALDSAAAVVVVDLSRPDALDGVAALRAAGSAARIVGYGRHTEPALLAAARAAGCDRVLVRSVFFADVPAAIA
jgi:DNA-binding NarL/FixJ family response regulator